jgi:mevalonate kinase
MGSSTAVVIAICRCLLGDDRRDDALAIEDIVNPGHSGLDFSVIWMNTPVSFKKGTTPQPVTLDLAFLKRSSLIDTGKPHETTAELVAWMRSRETEVKPHLEMIGRCTERLLAGEDPMGVIRDHHRAQVGLGVVTPEAQRIIADMEKSGGAAKVLGAGARTGGGGMILALNAH